MKGDPLRLMAVFPDGTSKTWDIAEKKGMETLDYHRQVEVIYKADLFVCVNLKTGVTHVLKNRYGGKGKVLHGLWEL